MRSPIRLVAASLLLFVISCEALPLHPSHDIGLRKDSQPGHSLAGDEADLAWKKVLCQLMHPGDSNLQIEATVREEIAAQTNQIDDQMILKTESEAQEADGKSANWNRRPSHTPSVSPSQTSGYSPDASGVIANSRVYDLLPDELNGYAGSNPDCTHIAKNFNGISQGRGRIEFLTPGIIITGVVILLLVTIAFFDFMQWIHLYRRRSKSRRRSSLAVLIIGEKPGQDLTFCDEDEYQYHSRKDMNV
ncbi:hypothetical protein TESG_04844 [Trichophyton tonsurans CBS 112818]|uniref:Uncharacterized protein n=1 Tax=Trichophyton tonsurans (strain CBS 112818) TaxID=647933 RepID=F2S1I6_TRIT1|nr:hypothetical protein TESG_04844 [Trichophyton tonsurans CBS 112818]